MATGGMRGETDAKIKEWERELERVRLALARAPDSVYDRYHPTFTEVYRVKEILKSRWEAVRGVYQAEPPALERFQEALKSMQAAWTAAQPMFVEVLKSPAA